MALLHIESCVGRQLSIVTQFASCRFSLSLEFPSFSLELVKPRKDNVDAPYSLFFSLDEYSKFGNFGFYDDVYCAVSHKLTRNKA